MAEDKKNKPKGIADIMVAFGLPSKKSSSKKDEAMAEDPDERGAAAGDELIEALSSGSGKDVYDAICAIIDTHESESYDVEEEDSDEEDDEEY